VRSDLVKKSGVTLALQFRQKTNQELIKENHTLLHARPDRVV